MEKGDFSLPNNTVWTPAGVKVKFGVIAEDMVWLAKRWNLFPQPAKGGSEREPATPARFFVRLRHGAAIPGI
jgi:hypothetical protein